MVKHGLPGNTGGGGGSRIGSGKGLGGSGGGGSGDKRQPIVVLTLAYATYTVGAYHEKLHQPTGCTTPFNPIRTPTSVHLSWRLAVCRSTEMSDCHCPMQGVNDAHAIVSVQKEIQHSNRMTGLNRLLLCVSPSWAIW